MRERKAGLTSFFAKHGFTLAMYACRITRAFGVDLGLRILRLLTLPLANGEKKQRAMSERVGSEAVLVLYAATS